MVKPKLIRITTVPLSLEKLLEGQLAFMSEYFDVTAISSERERLIKFAEKEGVDFFYLELTRKITPIKDLRAVIKLYKFLKREEPTIVHSHTPKAGLVAMLASFFARVPYRLHTVAGMPLLETKGFKKRILIYAEKLTYYCATKVYPNSKGLRDIIIKEKISTPTKLKVIGNGSSNGIDTHYFDPNNYSEIFKKNKRKELAIPNQATVLLFVGRLVKDKGIVELVNAFENLKDITNETHLVLVGPFEENLDPLPSITIERINLNPRIHVTGFREDVRPYFSIADLFVFPSYREGFPNVVMQSGAMKVPAIVSDINGCNEIIESGVNGIIVPSKDSDALQDAIQLLLNNHTSIVKMKQQSRTIIQNKYERKEIWELLLAEYHSFLS